MTSAASGFVGDVALKKHQQLCSPWQPPGLRRSPACGRSQPPHQTRSSPRSWSSHERRARKRPRTAPAPRRRRQPSPEMLEHMPCCLGGTCKDGGVQGCRVATARSPGCLRAETLLASSAAAHEQIHATCATCVRRRSTAKALRHALVDMLLAPLRISEFRRCCCAWSPDNLNWREAGRGRTIRRGGSCSQMAWRAAARYRQQSAAPPHPCHPQVRLCAVLFQLHLVLLV